MKRIVKYCAFIAVLVFVLTLGAAAAYASESSSQTLESSVKTSTSATSYTCNGYKVVSGTTKVHDMWNDDTYPMKYYYSDGYFAKAPSTYNEHLATFALTLSTSAQLELTSRYAKTVLKDIGCTNIEVSDGYYQINPRGYSPVILATKVLFAGTSKETTLVLVIPRSGSYNYELSDNFVYGESGDNNDIATSAKRMFAYTKSYMSQHGIDSSKAKFFTCGHSRGGSFASLIGTYLSDAYGKANVYAYCYNVPLVSTLSAKEAASYTNIHTILNYNDYASAFPSSASGWGFRQIGTVHYVNNDTESDFAIKEEAMLKQLAVVNPTCYKNYVSPTSFKWANLNLSYSKILSALSGVLRGDDFSIESLMDIDTNQTKGSSLQECIALARDRIIKYALPTRESYTTTNVPTEVSNAAKEIGTTETYSFETAFSELYSLLLHLSDDQSDALGENFEEIITPLISKPALISSLLSYLTEGTLSGIYNTYPKLVKGIWSLLDTTSGDYKKISSILTSEQTNTLKNALPIFLYKFALYSSNDYNQDKQTLGTIIYNLDRLIWRQHYCEIINSWLRSEDSFYANDTTYSATFKDYPAVYTIKSFNGSSVSDLSLIVKDEDGDQIAKVTNGVVNSQEDVTVSVSSSCITISIPAFRSPDYYSIEATLKSSAKTSYYILGRTCVTDTDPSLIMLNDTTPVSYIPFALSAGKTVTVHAHSDVGFVDKQAITPSSVTNLKAKTVTTSSITLSWTKSSYYVSGYKIYKNGSLCKTVKGASTVSCTVSSLGAGYSYYFKVVPYIGSTLYTSAKSATIYQPTKPVQAYVSKVTTGSSHYAKVTWTKRNCTGYLVQIAKNSKFTSGKVSAYVKSASTLSKTFTKLTKGKKYYVRVCAYKTYGGVTAYGAWSTIKTITIK